VAEKICTNGTPSDTRELPLSRPIPKGWWVPAIYDVIRIWERVVRVAIESKVDLPNTFLHGADKRGKLAKAIFVLFATFDAGHGQNSVIEDETDVGGFSRRRAGQHLSD